MQHHQQVPNYEMIRKPCDETCSAIVGHVTHSSLTAKLAKRKQTIKGEQLECVTNIHASICTLKTKTHLT